VGGPFPGKQLGGGDFLGCSRSITLDTKAPEKSTHAIISELQTETLRKMDILRQDGLLCAAWKT